MKDSKKGSLYYVLFATIGLDSVPKSDQLNVTFPPEKYIRITHGIAPNTIIILLGENRKILGSAFTRCLTSSGIFWIDRKQIRKISLVEQYSVP